MAKGWEARKGTNTQQEDNGHDERSEKGQEVSKTGPRLHGEPEMGQLRPPRPGVNAPATLVIPACPCCSRRYEEVTYDQFSRRVGADGDLTSMGNPPSPSALRELANPESRPRPPQFGIFPSPSMFQNQTRETGTP
ncbi:predicted protein [Histoplasma capsulatum H143]|uniref:Uncharacterized protein n=1 Tax=Ajellomyces capsulatus (strain H143) TaxID=544712 RepID=C6H305_AJECH|nr:predicted protein [Histoplasma capsulatum H143]